MLITFNLVLLGSRLQFAAVLLIPAAPLLHLALVPLTSELQRPSVCLAY